MRVDDVAGNVCQAIPAARSTAAGHTLGPGRHCAPRHRMPFISSNEGTRESALDDAAISGRGRHCTPRHRLQCKSRYEGSKCDG